MRRALVLWWQRLVDQGPEHFTEAWALSFLNVLSQATRAVLWVRSRKRRKPARMRCLVLCVGNLTLGGTGKTPVVRALALAMKSRGFKVAVACRSYRARARIPVRVPPGNADPRIYGDEPCLLASWLGDLPVYVARDRAAAARLADDEGA